MSNKKNEEKTQYHELYTMYTHDGTKQGHKKWKMSARAYFRKPETMVIHHVLQGHIQIDRIVENWPKKIELDMERLTTIPGTLFSPLSTPKPEPGIKRGKGKKGKPGKAPATPVEVTSPGVAPILWNEHDVIYTSRTALKNTQFTIQNLVTADAELMQLIIATANNADHHLFEVIPEGMEEVSGVMMLQKLDHRYGKIQGSMELISIVQSIFTSKFSYGNEKAADYYDRLHDLVKRLKGRKKYHKIFKSLVNLIFVQKIKREYFQPYDNMVMEWQKDPQRFEELMDAPFQEFRSLVVYSEDDIWGAFRKAQKIVRDKKSRTQSSNANSNSSDSKAHSSNSNGHDTSKDKSTRPSKRTDDPYCANCGNDTKLLSEYRQEKHITRNCPFPHTKKTREYLANKVKQTVDAEKFPQFALSNAMKPPTDEYESGQCPQGH